MASWRFNVAYRSPKINGLVFYVWFIHDKTRPFIFDRLYNTVFFLGATVPSAPVFSAEPRKGYSVISFLVVMTMVMGILSTSITMLWHQRDMQHLRIDRLRAEALVRSAWAWREMNPSVGVPELPIPFSPEQLRESSALPALGLPIDGTAYLIESGGVLWAVGIYGEVLEWGRR
jgi:hypothetical protein